MNKISLLLLMSFTTTLVLADDISGQQQTCAQRFNLQSDREACELGQQMQGGPRAQQSLQTSNRVRNCMSLLGTVAQNARQPSQAAETEQETIQRDAQGNVTGSTLMVNRTRPSTSEPEMPAGSTLSTGTLIWEDLNTKMPTAPTSPVPVILNVDSARNCRSLQLTAAGTGVSRFDATARNTAMDGRIYCVQLAGYTADYQSCVRALNMYNNVRMAESALFILQTTQAQNNQQDAQNSAAQRTAAGDGQNAAFDAQISMTQKASQLNQQKAMAYAAAVAALGSTLSSWIKNDEATAQRVLCSGNPGRLGDEPLVNEEQVSLLRARAPAGEFKKASAVSAPDCPQAVSYTFNTANDEMYANEQAKAGFKAALVELIAKGIQAGIAAKQLGDIAKKVEEAKEATEDPYNPATFEYCKVSPQDPRCITSNGRTPGSGLQDGGFSLGDGFGVNAFNPLGDAEDMTNPDLAPLPGDERVADTSNPFADDAKKANDILDPAAAASIQPGGGAGGGGGGGAGVPGGGSASLGNDVPGVDESKKENDIKANKADGKYNIAGGGSFQAVKPMAQENPFANLFGGKGGGATEDRGPASEDIAGRDSGLFAKISKRYGQVTADKRIEAKNLEE